MSKGKGTGFLTALVLAVVSFLVIFFFFSEAADKYLGVSFRNGKSSEVFKEKTKQVLEKVDDEITEDVSRKISESVKNLISKSK